MSFTWRRLLRIALNLIKSDQEEAGWRSSINRSYYAAFGEAREFAVSHGLAITRRKPTHEQVWQFLRGGGGQTNPHHQAALKAIGDIGIALRELRVQADYKLHAPPTESDAQRASLLANQLVKRLHGFNA